MRVCLYIWGVCLHKKQYSTYEPSTDPNLELLPHNRQASNLQAWRHADLLSSL